MITVAKFRLEFLAHCGFCWSVKLPCGRMHNLNQTFFFFFTFGIKVRENKECHWSISVFIIGGVNAHCSSLDYLLKKSAGFSRGKNIKWKNRCLY